MTTLHSLFVPTLAFLALALPLSLSAEDNLLKNADFAEDTRSWKLELLHAAEATFTTEDIGGGKYAAVVEVAAATEEPYYVNLYQLGLNLEGGKKYTLKFRAKASAEVTTSVNTLIAVAPWEQIWKQDLPLTTEWEEYTMDVIPSDSTDIGRFTFGRLGKQAGKYWFADVSLTPAD